MGLSTPKERRSLLQRTVEQSDNESRWEKLVISSDSIGRAEESRREGRRKGKKKRKEDERKIEGKKRKEKRAKEKKKNCTFRRN